MFQNVSHLQVNVKFTIFQFKWNLKYSRIPCAILLLNLYIIYLGFKLILSNMVLIQNYNECIICFL